MRRSPLVIAGLSFVAINAGKAQTPLTGASGGAAVTGVVRDSISLKPLRDAAVQLIAADSQVAFSRAVVSDSLGRFAIADVPDGSYLLGFFHPLLDSLGIDAPLRSIEVVGQRPVQVDLAVPSPAQLRTAICGRRAANAGSAVVGVVRDARTDAPLSGATVLGEWMELTYSSRSVTPTNAGVTVRSNAQGWFTLCGLPKAGIIALTASRGADSSGLIEIDVPEHRFMRRDLYLGAARDLAVSDTSGRHLRSGDGSLSGTVVAVASGKPISGAQVGVAGGPATRANDRGEWTLSEVPTGTRMLDVRAVGYYPERRPVDIVAKGAPIRVQLLTLRAMLDTIKVTAARRTARMATGFEDRRRSGAGTYFTSADVAKHNPIVTSDLFRYIRGVTIDNGSRSGQRMFVMPGAFKGSCNPEVYLNGHYMFDIGPDDVDSWVRPNEIDGIEIYSEATVPRQFHRSMGDCGAIVIWTKAW